LPVVGDLTVTTAVVVAAGVKAGRGLKPCKECPMKRVLIAVLVGLAFGIAARAAEEAKQIKGQVQQFDAKQRVLKVKVKVQDEDKVQTFRLKDDTPFVDADGRQISAEALIEQLAPGAQVTIVMQKQGAKQGPRQVAQVQVIRTKTKPKQKGKPDQADPKQKDKGKPDQSPAQKGKAKPDQSPAQNDKPKQKKDDQ
jgi:hypothetical protein